MSGRTKVFLIYLVIMGLMPTHVFAQDQESSIQHELFGSASFDFRYFPKDPLYEEQKITYLSLAVKPQLRSVWNNGRSKLYFTGFFRLDQHDVQRTHGDIRELYYQVELEKWSVSAGVKAVFWGKAESNHVVDIINQYDLLEGRDAEHKLGQPMVNISYASSIGQLDFYAMTCSRNVAFPGKQGRIRPSFPISKHPGYELKNGKYIPDVALRLTKNKRVVDYALSHYHGTDRLPLFTRNENTDNFELLYEEIEQTALEFQLTVGAFLWKLEAMNQVKKRDNFQAMVIGVEYSIPSLFQTPIELKILLEYSYDSRGADQINGMANDLFAGLNVALNDRQSTNIFFGGIFDLEYNSIIGKMIAETRLASHWKGRIKFDYFFVKNANDFYYMLRNDSLLEVNALYYF